MENIDIHHRNECGSRRPNLRENFKNFYAIQLQVKHLKQWAAKNQTFLQYAAFTGLAIAATVLTGHLELISFAALGVILAGREIYKGYKQKQILEKISENTPAIEELLTSFLKELNELEEAFEKDFEANKSFEIIADHLGILIKKLTKIKEQLIQLQICNHKEISLRLTNMEFLNNSLVTFQKQVFSNEINKEGALDGSNQILLDHYQSCRNMCDTLILEQKQYQQALLES